MLTPSFSTHTKKNCSLLAFLFTTLQADFLITEFFKLPPRTAGFALLAYKVGMALFPWNMLDLGLRLFRGVAQFVYFRILPGWVLQLVRIGSVIVSDRSSSVSQSSIIGQFS
jgi:hypothetical protein